MNLKKKILIYFFQNNRNYSFNIRYIKKDSFFQNVIPNKTKKNFIIFIKKKNIFTSLKSLKENKFLQTLLFLIIIYIFIKKSKNYLLNEKVSKQEINSFIKNVLDSIDNINYNNIKYIFFYYNNDTEINNIKSLDENKYKILRSPEEIGIVKLTKQRINILKNFIEDNKLKIKNDLLNSYSVLRKTCINYIKSSNFSLNNVLYIKIQKNNFLYKNKKNIFIQTHTYLVDNENNFSNIEIQGKKYNCQEINLLNEIIFFYIEKNNDFFNDFY